MEQHRIRHVRTRLVCVGSVLAAGLGIITSADPAGAAETVRPLLKIDFQAQGAVTPAGYTADFGQAFDAGRGYGWVAMASSTPVSMIGRGRERGVQPDQRLDTLMHAQPAGGTAARWEYAVANGTYEVKIAVGDPAGYFDSRHVARVEAVKAISGYVPTNGARHKVVTVRVPVSDGRLSLSPEGGLNTKYDYIEISRVTATSPTTTAPTPTTTAPTPTTAAPTPTTAAPTPTTAAPTPTTAAPTPTTAAPTPTTAAPTPTTAAPTPTTTAPGGGTSGVTPGWGAHTAWDGFGSYVEGGRDGIDKHEDWMGRDVNYRVVFTGIDSFDQARTNFSALTDPTKGYLANNDRTLIISIGLTMKDGSSGDEKAKEKLQAAANGANDAFWTWVGQTMHSRGLDRPYPDGRPRVALRVGWENNGTWYPWSTTGGNELYASAWRRAHDKVSASAPDAVWSWGLTVNGQSSEDDVRASYPGDAYVDVVEMDVYDSWGSYPSLGGDADPSRRPLTWNKKLHGSVGLDFLASFAAQHHKLIGITEMGLWRENVSGTGQIGGGDNPEFIANMYRWLDEQAAAGRLAWANYFEVNNGTKLHQLRGDGSPNGSAEGSQFPVATRKFLELFGG